MSQADAYVMLISSLPNPESLFRAKRPPLSRLKLDQRLRVLTAEDARTLKLVEGALDWRRLPIDAAEGDIIARGRRALAHIDNPTLQRIVRDRLEIRSCVAALRRRARGEGPPLGKPWGFGRWVGHIERNWSDAGFRLDGVFPWLREADGLIRHSDAAALERLLLQQAYRRLQRVAGSHTFDIEAVVIYVLKWNIVNRTTRYNRVAATRRFEALSRSGLGKQVDLF